jgi:hypothetical protein
MVFSLWMMPNVGSWCLFRVRDGRLLIVNIFFQKTDFYLFLVQFVSELRSYGSIRFEF